jgi:hypothetical protein
VEAKPEKLKQVLSLIFSHLKALETEVLAFRAVFATVKRLGVVSDLDERLHAATLTAEQKMSAKYDAPLENALKRIDESAFDELLVKLLEKWKPTDPVN